VAESGVVHLARRIVIENLEEIGDFFNEALEKRLEGIIIKAMNNTSIYEAGKRSWLWLKWKEEYAEGMRGTFDLVIVGKYYGRERKSSFGALLCAALKEGKQRFETFKK
jgi:DNA ligase-1